MAHEHPPSHQSHQRSSRSKWIFFGFLAVGGFFLFTEHRAHLYGALPFLLILACPLMHLFHGHGGHGGSHDNQINETNGKAAPNTPPHAHDHGREQS